jgi:hypothetical protein
VYGFDQRVVRRIDLRPAREVDHVHSVRHAANAAMISGVFAT